jgi:hypothetical protein
MCFDGMEEILQHGHVAAHDSDALGDVLNGLPVGLGVQEDHRLTRMEQTAGQMRPDKSCAAGNHDRHRWSPSLP